MNKTRTIPFFGYSCAIDVQPSDDHKDLIFTFTFPDKFDDIAEFTEKAIKYFDGQLIRMQQGEVKIKADKQMVGYTLLYSFRDHYTSVK